MKDITEALLELNFKKKKYGGHEAYVREAKKEGNRFLHTFVYYEDENCFYINRMQMSGLTTISESRLLDDHNENNTPAKNEWLEIKNELLKNFRVRVVN